MCGAQIFARSRRTFLPPEWIVNIETYDFIIAQSSPRIDPRRAGTIDLLAHSDAILGVILSVSEESLYIISSIKNPP